MKGYCATTFQIVGQNNSIVFFFFFFFFFWKHIDQTYNLLNKARNQVPLGHKIVEPAKRCYMHSFETRSGKSTWDSADPGLELGRVEEKIEEGKNRCDPARPDQKLGCNPLTFVFFLLKRRRFDFKKTWPGRPGQNPEPRFWTGPGLKTMVICICRVNKKHGKTRNFLLALCYAPWEP